MASGSPDRPGGRDSPALGAGRCAGFGGHVLVTVGGRRHDLPQLLDAQRRDQLAELCLRAACGATRHDASSLRYPIAGQASERRGGQLHRRRSRAPPPTVTSRDCGSNVGEPLMDITRAALPGLISSCSPCPPRPRFSADTGASQDLCLIADARRARPGVQTIQPAGRPRRAAWRWVARLPPPSRIGRPGSHRPSGPALRPASAAVTMVGGVAFVVDGFDGRDLARGQGSHGVRVRRDSARAASRRRARPTGNLLPMSRVCSSLTPGADVDIGLRTRISVGGHRTRRRSPGVDPMPGQPAPHRVY